MWLNEIYHWSVYLTYLSVPSGGLALVLFLLLTSIFYKIHRDIDYAKFVSIVITVIINPIATLLISVFFLEYAYGDREAGAYVAPYVAGSGLVWGFVGALLGAFILSRRHRRH